MTILILGGNGMAGHMIRDYLSLSREHQIIYTHRTVCDDNGYFLDCTDYEAVKKMIDQIQPDVVINAVGLLNEATNRDLKTTLKINSLLPHMIVDWIEPYRGKFIHISTDCVFSGNRGAYTEDCPHDSTTTYGKSKSLGEVKQPNHLTIRTSVIGPEIKDGLGLFQWFMKQNGTIKGYDKVLWNGVTTLELAKFIDEAIDQGYQGLYQLTSKVAQSKYSLLLLINQIFDRNINIVRDSKIQNDKTLLNTRTDIAYNPKTHEDMLVELREWMKQHDYS